LLACRAVEPAATLPPKAEANAVEPVPPIRRAWRSASNLRLRSSSDSAADWFAKSLPKFPVAPGTDIPIDAREAWPIAMCCFSSQTKSAQRAAERPTPLGGAHRGPSTPCDGIEGNFAEFGLLRH
jgi:hypothetical protein